MFLFQEDATEYFSEFFNARERSLEFQGCCKTHSWSQTLQVPQKAFSISADGLRVCRVADALPVHFPTEGL